jgi:6-phosphogluconolactonase
VSGISRGSGPPVTATRRARRDVDGADEPRIVVVPTSDDVADAAADLVCDALARAIDERGEAHIALTGGSSAAPLYQRLAVAPWRDRVDWRRVHLWWGDERYVPTEHPESNARLAEQMLLGLAARATLSGEGAQSSDVLAGSVPGVAVPADQIHAFPVNEAIGRGPSTEEWAASSYAETIRSLVPSGPEGIPIFDVVLLGVGPDGHVLSVFPRSTALGEDAPLVVAVPAPEHVGPHVARLTLNPRVLAAARLIAVMIAGGSKATTVARVLGDERNPQEWPAQLARRSGAVWILDEAAAAELPRSVRPAVAGAAEAR